MKEMGKGSLQHAKRSVGSDLGWHHQEKLCVPVVGRAVKGGECDIYDDSLAAV